MKTTYIIHHRVQKTLKAATLALALLFVGSTAQAAPADTLRISGVVFDAATRLPLPGARIQAHSQPRFSAMTDESGHYELKIPAYVTLLDYSAPDYNISRQSVKQSGTIDAQLYSTSFRADFEAIETQLGDYGQTGDLSLSTAASIDEEIQSQLGGDLRAIMRGGTPGMGAAMFVGGLNSLNANAMPMIIIDGVYIDPEYSRGALHDGFYNNVLANYSVNDIESVKVLKNATSLYGTKGSNGVILINTRRSKSMATRIDASLSAGVTFLPQLPQMMNASQYRLYASELIGSTDTEETTFHFLNDSKEGNYYYNKYHQNTDWSDYTYRQAITQNYSIGVQGGDEIAKYNLTLGYTNAQSTLEYNDFSRLNIRFNTDVELSTRLGVKFDVSFSKSTRDMRDDGTPADFTSNPVTAPGFLSLIKSPFLSPYVIDEAGNTTVFYEDADTYTDGFGTNTSLGNPVGLNSEAEGKNKNWLESSLFNIAITPIYKINKNLSAQTHFSYNLTNLSEHSFSPMNVVPVFYLAGMGNAYNKVQGYYAKHISVFNDTRLTWNKQWSNHRLQVMGGFRYTDDSYNSKLQTGYNTGNNKTPNLHGNLDFKSVEGDDDIWRSAAYYLNANYNYRNTYYLDGAVAMETSSRFGREVSDGIKLGGVHWGIFPSLQAAWLISSEKWFPASHAGVGYLKLRAGYDESGNDDINIYAARTSLSPTKFLNNSIGLVFDNIGNTKIQWETTRRLSAGLDASLFGSRVTLGAGIFKSYTDNLLTLKSMKQISGKETFWSNDGKLENLGYDASLNVKILNSKNLKWEAGLSVAHYKSEITALPDGDYYDNGKAYGHLTTAYGAEVLTSVGNPAGLFYGYKTRGVYATTQEAQAEGLYIETTTGSKLSFAGGDVKFLDIDGDKKIGENDKTVIGDPNPDIYGNIYTTVNWKRFTLDVLLNYCVGNDVYNYQRSQLEAGSRFFNQTSTLARRWIGEGQQTDIPRATFGDPMGNSRFSDRWIEDGSYLRLKSVTLSYNLPLQSTWLHGLTVWCSGNNLLTLTKYLGSDPEFSAGNSVLMQGIDRGLLSQSRSVTLGVKFNL